MEKKYHYVYRITNIKKNRHYYGKRSTNIEPKQDLGNKYFSSSKNKGFIRNQKENPQNFKYKIIKVFDTSEQATKFEIKLHRRLNVQAHHLFYNNANQIWDGFYRTGNNKYEDNYFKNKEYNYLISNQIKEIIENNSINKKYEKPMNNELYIEILKLLYTIEMKKISRHNLDLFLYVYLDREILKEKKIKRKLNFNFICFVKQYSKEFILDSLNKELINKGIKNEI